MDPNMSPRIWKLLERIVRFNIIVQHVTAKENLMADFLSKTDTDYVMQHADVNLLTGGVVLDPKLLALIDLAKADKEYQAVIEAMETKAKLAELHRDHPAKKVSRVYQKLETFQAPNGCILLVEGARVYIPEAGRQQTLEELHTCHAGASIMQATAALNAYWPGIAQDIVDYVGQCVVCSTFHRHHLPPPSMDAHETADLKPLD